MDGTGTFVDYFNGATGTNATEASDGDQGEVSGAHCSRLWMGEGRRESLEYLKAQHEARASRIGRFTDWNLEQGRSVMLKSKSERLFDRVTTLKRQLS